MFDEKMNAQMEGNRRILHHRRAHTVLDEYA